MLLNLPGIKESARLDKFLKKENHVISMGNREVGSGKPVYIVFEAGPTHTGLTVAKKLAEYAKIAGADAIKFQITDHNKLIQDRKLLFNYKVIDKKAS